MMCGVPLRPICAHNPCTIEILVDTDACTRKWFDVNKLNILYCLGGTCYIKMSVSHSPTKHILSRSFESDTIGAGTPLKKVIFSTY